MYLIGMDDTDNLESRGTGYMARQVAATLRVDHDILGVIRHQLLVDPRVPYTKRNSSAAIVIDAEDLDQESLADRVRALMLADYQPGSDPGLCIAHCIPAAFIEFGRRAKRELVTQEEARTLAADHGMILQGLGGNQGGVIGALAAVGLAASGDDGRYVMVGSVRELEGLHPVSALLEAGVDSVQTTDGEPVTHGLVQTDKLRPARRAGKPVAIVVRDDEHWTPLKLD
jgi:tRNA(Ile2) C34 agmatinyltransferase TiaS